MSTYQATSNCRAIQTIGSIIKWLSHQLPESAMNSPVRASDTPIAVEVEAGKSYFWCACGLSQKQPFCDGSHSKDGKFSPIKYQAEASKRVFFCGCKQTNKAPLCDGSHNR